MNLLANETSPYLRQHKDNPVHWQPWGATALAEAKRAGKPILLSIGYAACHWCHVMAHESFEDGETADLMNKNFVNIKVDREERPDIDMIFQNALALMGQHGGWPLTMFLTPEGEPFWGGTYFPPLARHGLPGFREVLRGVQMSWGQEQEKISHNVKSLTAALHKMQTRGAGDIVTRDQLDKIGAYLLSISDHDNGGIGAAPKFPSLTITSLIWDSYLRTGGAPFKAAVIHALTSMCQGGIYDHIGGGFCRYAVDAEWLVPHFEKMLYDNALFINLLSEVYRETKNALFESRIRETVEWLKHEMMVGTAFASSLDADSHDSHGHLEEGAYYVWSAADIDEVLGPDARYFAENYDVSTPGNWEGKNIPNRLRRPGVQKPAEEKRMADLRDKLAERRRSRIAPARDDKVLADWNGLMITALAKASFALDAPEYLTLAKDAFSFVTKNMMQQDGRLWHVFCDGRTAHAATLDDYANLCDAALALFSVTGDKSFLQQAEAWVAIAVQDYWDEDGKGFFLATTGQELLVRPKTADDTATPAGNGTMVSVLGRLSLITGNQDYAARATETARAFSGDLLQRFFPLSTLLSASDFLEHPVSLVLAGDRGREDFIAVLKNVSFPQLVVMNAAEGLPPTHPAAGKEAVGGRATAYLCPYRACLPPITEAADLKNTLLSERRRNLRGAANDS
ncbi:MAG: thioredoxin domain-containing protein [Alphaproteobacteria bacterium]